MKSIFHLWHIIPLLTFGLASSLFAQTFTKLTAGNVVTDAGNSVGMAWGDYDGDGNLDLFVANWAGLNNSLYHNNGDGTFTKITTGSVVNDGGNSASCAWGDYDNDGHLDLFVANAYESNFLYHNNGNGTFAKVTSGAIVTDVGGWYGCAWGDYDNDGYIDLYVANVTGPNVLYRNNRDGTFSKVTTGNIVTEIQASISCAWGDYDNDGWLDLFVARGLNQDNALYHNSGDGTFTKVATGGIVVSGSSSVGCAWGDYDNDGYLDLYVPNRLQPGFLFHNNGNGTFTRITSGSIVTDVNDGDGCSWGDYDNDGYLDLFVANWRGQNDALYQNNGNGTFTKVTTGGPVIAGGDGTGCGWGDFNNDGQLDLFVSNGPAPTTFGAQSNFLYRNDGNNNSWITINCVGTASNRSGIGARVKVNATIQGTLRSQVRQISSANGWDGQALNAHFGLGNATVIASLRLEWPSGAIQTLNNVAVNQTLTVTELVDDGIPAAWRAQYFGANPIDPRAAATADPDGDGANNYQEFRDGTNPLDAKSVNRIPLSISTWAGSEPGGRDGFRTNATFFMPGLARVDRQGRMWVNEAYLTGFWSVGVGGHRVRIIDTNGVVSTVAGSEEPGLVEGPAPSARFRGPSGIVFDTFGSTFIVDRLNHRIRKLDTNGVVSTFAGSTEGYRDGVGQNAQFASPIGLAIDASNNLYVADFFNYRIRKVTPQAEVTTFTGSVLGAQDGPLASATFNSPSDLEFGPDGALYVADWLNGSVRKIKDGVVSTAVSGWSYVDSVGTDASGNLYVSADGNHALLKYAADGKLVWQLSPELGFADGPIAVAKWGVFFSPPIFLPDGNFLMTDPSNNRIRLVTLGVPPLLTMTPSGGAFTSAVSVVLASSVPNAVIRFTVDGSIPTKNSSSYSGSFEIASTARVNARVFVNNAPVSDVLTGVFEIANSPGTPPGVAVVTTLAGSGAAGFADGQGVAAQFNFPNGAFVDASGFVYVADGPSHRIRRVSPNGAVTTLAGSGAAGNLDGPGAAAQFNYPLGVFVATAGDIFVADTENNRVRKISPVGFRTVSTVAGSGQPGYVDGPGATAKFNFPNDLVVDAAGNIFVSEFNNHTIRKIAPDGAVSTFVGNGAAGYADGRGTSARLNRPGGLAIDISGNLFVTDWGNQRIRKITPDGSVTTLAGSGLAGFVDGPASIAQFKEPDGITVDQDGNVFITEFSNHAVRKIAPDGTVTTIAGKGAAGFADGTAAVALFNTPGGIGIDSAGNLFVADTGNNRIRKIAFGTPPQIIVYAMRQLPLGYFPGIRFTVTVAANPPIGTTVYAVEDQPPVGWTVANPNNGGHFDALNQTVKFGPFFDANARVLTYEITPATSESGPKRFSGTISVDGLSAPTGGADVINSESLHPADTKPADHRIAIDELTAYSAAWRKGQGWVNPPNPIPIDYVTRAGALWKNGEAYHVDPSVSAPPLWWVNDTAGPTVGRQGLTERSVLTPTSMVTADTPDHFIITEPFTVTLHVTPSAGVSVYAAEDQISYPGYPADSTTGLQVTNISHNGEYDSNGGQIRWGPFFDNQPRDLSYQVVMPYTPPRLLDFTGSVSFDGAGVQVAGKREVVAGSRLNFILGRTNEPIQLELLGSGTYRIEASTNLIDWTTVMEAVVLKDLRFIELNAGDFHKRFYRAREIR